MFRTYKTQKYITRGEFTVESRFPTVEIINSVKNKQQAAFDQCPRCILKKKIIIKTRRISKCN